MRKNLYLGQIISAFIFGSRKAISKRNKAIAILVLGSKRLQIQNVFKFCLLTSQFASPNQPCILGISQDNEIPLSSEIRKYKVEKSVDPCHDNLSLPHAWSGVTIDLKFEDGSKRVHKLTGRLAKNRKTHCQNLITF